MKCFIMIIIVLLRFTCIRTDFVHEVGIIVELQFGEILGLMNSSDFVDMVVIVENRITMSNE